MPTRLSLLLPSFSLLALLPVPALTQTTIVSYSFEDTLTADIGADRSVVTWNSGGAEGYTSPFASQGRALSVNGFQFSEYLQITLDATGYQGITMNSFRSNGTATAPLDWSISYGLAGSNGTFAEVATFLLASNTASADTTIPGFSLVEGANNNPFVVVRLTATSSSRIDGGLGAANGSFRVDNISFSGTAIPEPSAYAALAGLAALALRLWQRRRLRSGHRSAR